MNDKPEEVRKFGWLPKGSLLPRGRKAARSDLRWFMDGLEREYYRNEEFRREIARFRASNHPEFGDFDPQITVKKRG